MACKFDSHVRARKMYNAALHADIMSGRYLGNANEAEERGQYDKAERLYAKSQYWLDRYNHLTGNGGWV